MARRDNDAGFEDLVEYLRAARGLDFTGYKRPSLIRRVQKRLDELKVGSFADYKDYLEVHPDEFEHLFNTILINVTGFFRDPVAWDALRDHAVKNIIDSHGDIRIWCAGCASGEEAYTVAMVFADTLGPEIFAKRVKVYATDIDDEALNVGRQASYSVKDVDPVPEDFRERFFEKSGTRFVFRPTLRRSVIFGRHDLVQDAPISRLNLLVCRNTLMYLNAETQARVLANFHFGLNDDGYLFLGRAEMLLSHSKLFVPIDVHTRIFTKVPRSGLRERLIAQVPSLLDEEPRADAHHLLRDAAVDVAPVAAIIVDVDGLFVTANEQARALFGLSSRDAGRPFNDLEISYRPLELRSRIEQAYAERRPVTVNNVERNYGDGETQHLDVQIAPVLDVDGSPIGASISFTDNTRYWKLRRDLERSNQDLETAYEELQSTNEELETTNEELQSTIEELETTNEELQSSNEELETMNEELQSTNSELHALNDELQRRTNDLNRLSAFSEGVLRSIRSALIVVDRNLTVHTWTKKTEDMWGLRSDEAVGQPLLELDIGLPVRRLRDALRGSLSGEEVSQLSLEARDRRGRPVRCTVTVSALRGSDDGVQGVVLLMDTELRASKKS